PPPPRSAPAAGSAARAPPPPGGGGAGRAAPAPPPPPGTGTPADAVPWVRLDAADARSCEETVAEVRPDRLVLVHGPSDVTWCEADPERAAALHTAATAHLTAAAPGRRTVLISTDNVFDGTSPVNGESAPTAPANAYGRAKLAAERIVRESADGTVLRVSLIYGWEPPETTKWLNFFSSCAHRLRAGERVEVPGDQWTTPVLVEDVAAVTAAVLPTGAPPLLHLGGPDRISRADWAEAIADALGVPRSQVVRVPKAAGRYASRPTNTCLTSELLDGFLAARGLRVRGVAEGLRALLKEAE
ncbi:SDR family oxidoreductase, partial [Streptomyces sp. NPDC056140]|uniref:SDR family oxidoreductase n=1 Tax=Streptomyces sp. NPDC056140 TaxID=3345725 RepID=UPI0035DBC08B